MRRNIQSHGRTAHNTKRLIGAKVERHGRDMPDQESRMDSAVLNTLLEAWTVDGTTLPARPVHKLEERLHLSVGGDQPLHTDDIEKLGDLLDFHLVSVSLPASWSTIRFSQHERLPAWRRFFRAAMTDERRPDAPLPSSAEMTEVSERWRGRSSGRQTIPCGCPS